MSKCSLPNFLSGVDFPTFHFFSSFILQSLLSLFSVVHLFSGSLVSFLFSFLCVPIGCLFQYSYLLVLSFRPLEQQPCSAPRTFFSLIFLLCIFDTPGS
ncbi:hypothetical protein BJX64DRAFT_96047 [Aspergillus heterothallicus]